MTVPDPSVIALVMELPPMLIPSVTSPASRHTFAVMPIAAASRAVWDATARGARMMTGADSRRDTSPAHVIWMRDLPRPVSRNAAARPSRRAHAATSRGNGKR